MSFKVGFDKTAGMQGLVEAEKAIAKGGRAARNLPTGGMSRAQAQQHINSLAPGKNLKGPQAPAARLEKQLYKQPKPAAKPAQHAPVVEKPDPGKMNMRHVAIAGGAGLGAGMLMAGKKNNQQQQQ